VEAVGNKGQSVQFCKINNVLLPMLLFLGSK
jgi:hypothetical protein